MIEGRQDLGLAREPGTRAIHLTHPAGANGGENLVRTQTGADSQGHQGVREF